MEDILGSHTDIEVDNNLPSYVQAFLSDVPSQVLFLHKTISSELGSPNSNYKQSKLSSPDLDITGSPLKCTIYSVHFNDSIVLTKEFWSDEESTHAPISLNESRAILDKYLNLSPDCAIPLWIACNGNEATKTLLLCGFKDDGWCSRSIVHFRGMCSASCLSEHSDIADVLSTLNHDGAVTVNCMFNILDKNIFDTSNNTYNCSSGENFKKINVDLSWQYPSIKVPEKGVSANLITELEVGHPSSVIYCLWQQLATLKKYFNMLNTKEKKYLTTYEIPDAIACENTATEILKLIYKQENIVETLTYLKIDQDCKSDQQRLFYLVKQVLECQHSNSDIADKIWLLLNERENIQEITTSLNEVLTQLGKQPQKIHAILKKDVLLNIIISAHLNGNLAVSEVSLEKTLKIMVETGIDKLKQDYCFIFKFLALECNKYFKKLSPSLVESSDLVNNNINVLTQLHVALEFILGSLRYLDISGNNLTVFAQNILEQCFEKISMSTLEDNLFISLEIPVMCECVVNCIPSAFLRLRIKKSSNNPLVKNYKIILVSSRPIFPPSLIRSDEQLQHNTTGDEGESLTSEKSSIEEENYIYRLIHCSDRIS